MKPMAVILVASGQGLMAVMIPNMKADRKGTLVASSQFCNTSMMDSVN
jgi:hypothetical protein